MGSPNSSRRVGDRPIGPFTRPRQPRRRPAARSHAAIPSPQAPMKLLLSLLLALPSASAQYWWYSSYWSYSYWYSYNSYSYSDNYASGLAPTLGSGADGRCHYLCTTTCMTDNSNAYIFTHSHESDGPDPIYRQRCLDNQLGLSYVCTIPGVVVTPVIDVLAGTSDCYETTLSPEPPALPPSPMPPPPPPALPKGSLCTENCYFDSDGYCDDGGEGAQYSMCDLGSDCTGARRPESPRRPQRPYSPPIFPPPPARPGRAARRLRPADDQHVRRRPRHRPRARPLGVRPPPPRGDQGVCPGAHLAVRAERHEGAGRRRRLQPRRDDAPRALGRQERHRRRDRRDDGARRRHLDLRRPRRGDPGALRRPDVRPPVARVRLVRPGHQPPRLRELRQAALRRRAPRDLPHQARLLRPPRAEADRAVRLRLRSGGLLQDARQPAARPRLLRSRRLGRHVVLRRRSVAVPDGDAVGRLPERGVGRLLVGRQRPDRPRHVPRPLHGARRGDVVREALRCRPGVHGLRRRRVPHGLQCRPLRRVPHVHHRDPRQRRGVRARRRRPVARRRRRVLYQEGHRLRVHVSQPVVLARDGLVLPVGGGRDRAADLGVQPVHAGPQLLLVQPAL